MSQLFRADRIVNQMAVVRDFPRLIESFERDPEPYLVLKRGKPVAVITPFVTTEK